MIKKIKYLSEEETPHNSLKKLKEELKKCKKEKEEYLTQTQIARADLINYRRRQEQALEELKGYCQSNLISEVLPVLDSLRIGSEHNEELGRIKKQLDDILKKHGLEEIDAVGKIFDPRFHEAIEEVESDSEEGIILEEFQKGYLVNKKLLRPSRVKVAK